MTVIDFNAVKASRDGPHPEFIRSDDYGNQMYAYSLQYQMNDLNWDATIWAYSMQDAEQRAEAMRNSLVLLGQIHSIVPA